MSPEKGFLDAILREPQDTGHLIIYADWLEDQGDLRRAEFLRLEARRRQNDPESAALLIRQRELLPEIGVDWLALLDRTALVGCRRGACPARWENLELTLQARVRLCGACGRFVEHHARLETIHEQLAEGLTVAVDSRIELTVLPPHLDPLAQPDESLILELRDQIQRLAGQPGQSRSRRRRRRAEE